MARGNVYHTCDNTISLAIPAHLWRGTAMDNRNDMIRKGYAQHGKDQRTGPLS